MPVFRVLAAVAAALVGSLLLGVPEAGAAGPSITVSPSAGLIDGQTVTVSGTGFTVGAPTLLVLDECANVASPDINDCSTSTGVFSPYISEPDNFVQTYTVSRFITTTNQGSLDCAAPNACAVVAWLGYIGYQQATAPISFSSSGTPVPNFRIIDARLIVPHVPPGAPVELGVLAADEGPTPRTWAISQSNDVGLVADNAICPLGSAQGPATCVYSPTQRGVGQPALAVFELEAAPGFTGSASATVCATDLDSQDSGPGSQPPSTCEVVTTNIG